MILSLSDDRGLIKSWLTNYLVREAKAPEEQSGGITIARTLMEELSRPTGIEGIIDSHSCLHSRIDSGYPESLSVVVLGLGLGSCLQALVNILYVLELADHDWRALQCVGANKMVPRATPSGLGTETRNAASGSYIHSRIHKKPFLRTGEPHEGFQDIAGGAIDLGVIFVKSSAQVLVLDNTTYE